MKRVDLRRILIFWLLGSLWINGAATQRSFLPDTLFLTNTIDSFIDLTPYTTVLVDSSASLNWQQAWKKKENGAFFPLEDLEMEGKFARGRYDYWVLFVLHNQMADRTLATYLEIALADSISLHVIENDTASRLVTAGKRTHDLYGRTDLPFCGKNDIPFFLAPRQTYTCLVRLKNQNSFPAPLRPSLVDQTYHVKEYESGYRFYYAFHGGFFTLLLFLAIFTLVQYFQNRDKAFLFYAFYIIALFLFYLREFDLRNQFEYIFPLYLHEHRFYSVFGIGIFIAYFLFIDFFLNARERFPWLHRFIRWAVAGFFIFVAVDQVIATFDPLLSWKIIYGFRMVVGAISLAILLWLLQTKDRLASYIVIGTLILLCGSLTTIVVTVLEVFEESWWDVTQVPAFIGIAAELLFFSTVLGYRQRMAEEEKSRVEKELFLKESEASNLKKISQLKTNFFTNITHEFRTPLTVIQGMAHELKDNQEARKLILQNSDQLLNLINQLLDLSKVESGSMPLHLVQSDIISYLSYLTESLHSFAFSKKINLSFYSELEALNMDFDPEKVQQIVINLISNAIKFTPEYGKIMVVGKTEQADDEVLFVLKISDTGAGIPEDKLPHIFDRFFQVDGTVTRDGEGTGIGLALVKELTELHGGSIQVESEVDRGATFTLTFPITRNAARVQPDLPEDSKKTKVILAEKTSQEGDRLKRMKLLASDKGNPRLLIIEDNYGVVQYLKTVLAGAFAIQVARNGNAGIEKALSEIPDIIISDVMMPEKDGFEVCRTLKQDERTSHIPIILLTARATVADKVEGLSFGADAYLMKPFNKEELIVRLEKLLELRQQLQQKYSEFPDLLNQDEPAASPDEEFLRKLHQLIIDRMDDGSLKVNDLLRPLGISLPQLNRKMNALTGKPTAAYIRSFRLNHARKLLEKGEWSVTQIAMETGFKSPSHFSQAFKNEFGHTPTEARR